MKAKTLKQILNTKRPVADYGEYIAVGSYLCHDLIKVVKTTMKVSYALDTFHEGKKSLEVRDDSELLDIWNKLESLIESGDLQEIIDGIDESENAIPVYSFDEDKGEIVESFCEEFGYPNSTLDGKLMYDNTHFKTRIEAIDYAIKNTKAGIELSKRSIGELQKKMKDQADYLIKQNKNLEYLIDEINRPSGKK